MFSVRPYAASDAPAWDALVASSRNGNLLHRRGYMDYHADRFVDASLLVERGGEVVAVFPASVHGDCVSSHAGLTYAGLLSSMALRAGATLQVFEQIAAHYRARAVRQIVYKPVPHVFHAYPAEEDLYALHRLGAQLFRRDLSSVIALREPFAFSAERRRSLVKARKAGVQIQTGTQLEAFHALLTQVLQRHGVAPTHRLDELQLLHSRFPQQIVLHEARAEGQLVAAALVLDFGRSVHTQYLAVSECGRQLDALSLLLAELITEVYAQRHYFSFGISTEQGGQVLNDGLVEQKERFGARAVVQDFYRWTL
ncbi:GNAT family N-acetyltransferase [Xanthomonas hortorum]|uniref:GNAT family N-acetyltransferase n=1 Tax=Xanthomonas hortorum pv. pelargonii TaxID=453602 RepID=A0A6V7D210_9XANT|nr:GNAT family N-acetyltransferase [Xanthomonas hortorum]MCE4353676.1 GNAT family N-acetyltransferase [Xanthomonas hortorum pv. pelargonii]MCM5525034.1 GNAT family N-acetyltransferase [Xanthomonas hortorum pv. pelargonii]MCM5537558.1 GNAT family N-acetyltransferase [Xanthomonas hortorum pv. pelargonii]MCM5541732.1 GNAT family N-acetyltransferase [Xanthomonas hortorum pv. pelargonii]MCM5545053.1 GNAT family N-acetyltransferase [Xanthomonas hortorum pv. pelargonii]